MENLIVYIFVGLLSLLGTPLISNDVANFLAVKANWPFWPTFVGCILTIAGGALFAHWNDKLFWYAGILALISASYSITALGIRH